MDLNSLDQLVFTNIFRKTSYINVPLLQNTITINTIYHSRTLAQHKITALCCRKKLAKAASSVCILTEIGFLSKATRERNWVKMEKRGLGLYPRQKLSNCSGLAPSCITFQGASVTDKLYLMQPKCTK